jgi:hypothetical protein
MTTYRTRRLGATALAAAGLLASCPAAASATSHATDPRSPDAKDAATQAHVQVLSRSDPRSPDARDASLAAIRRAPAPTPVVVRVSHPGHSA